jgi:alkanesulfonate monooxygenase SsuD/methylene tetrahydromethanopterin reductase-like flavin-dependent oxidoreductase (luciferase family)
MRGLTQPVLDFEGEFYKFKDVPMVLQPLQKPYPPLWYGVVQPDSGTRAGKRGLFVMTNTRTSNVRAVAETYWENFTPRPGTATSPRFGMNRFMVIADTDEAALAIARRAYRRWHASFMNLWDRHGIPPTGVSYPPEFDGQAEDGRAIAGSPDTVRKELLAQLEETGVNHIGCRFAFGDLTLAEALRSVDLFAAEVMPALRERVPEAAE